ncbi:SEFIR domain-containing protein [Paenibacillus sp. FA6]|uniref:SEFIR domain-containing protein n=1 Tax=Paenibacillus sp. FA6 TaxID=3413029 RepID=UPI003F66039D
MIQQALVNPRVFISYSWTTPEHEEWVVDLATRLRHHGIDVILDKWDLKEGHDVYAFMEAMVTSESVDKVLIICDEGYQKRADSRVGGVGTETQIITPQIYKDINQEKFIPIVAERDNKGNHFIPIYIATRLYIDLSSSEAYEESYDKLIRNIYKVPLHKKPSLGKAPEYLFENETTFFQTATVIRQMKASADKNPNRVKYLWNDFVDTFYESIKGLDIGDNINDADQKVEKIVKLIDESLPLRNDYIVAVELLCMTDTIEADHIIEFFEKMYTLTEFQGNGSYFEFHFDHYKFLLNELFLYSIAILLRMKKYSLVNQVLNAEYYVESNRSEKPSDFTGFRFYLQSLDSHNENIQLNRVSLHADLLVQRAFEKYKKELIITDIILYNLSKIYYNDWSNIWFPITYIYLNQVGVIKIFSKLKSRSHFETVKVLFNDCNEIDFKSKIIEMKSDRGYSNGRGGIPIIRNFINPDEICTIP